MADLPDFSTFFHTLWGHEPFPWQERLAEHVAARGWPPLLDIPTGCGKTAALDVALHHLAREAARPDRRAPLRIVYVVDRRLVVDAAWRRARRMEEALAAADDGPLAAVAAALRHIAGDGPPLRVVRLRGGMPLEPDAFATPLQPTIVLSTVDQAGSRLLFRGYGVSPAMWPVHAGLLGNDVLYLVDEAHLSRPFVETLEAAARERRRNDAALDPPFAFCRLTATDADPAGNAFGLEEEDRCHGILGARLRAAKPARLAKVDGDEDALTAALEREATAFLAAGHLRIGVVVNRVLRARMIFERLAARVGERVDLLLAIGRARPLERDLVAEELETRLGPGAGNGERPVILVATQTVEVGADFDFDALVTELAPLDALRQRFGRLNRFGRYEASAVVLARASDLEKKASDPIYGGALRETWKWLSDRPGKGRSFDFGIEALREHETAVTPDILVPRAHAPSFLPAYAEALARTSPRPVAEPEISLFLHGPDTEPAEIRLAWRVDLSEKDMDDPERAKGIVAALPPSSLEALELPLWVARAWLRGGSADVADLEGAPAGEEDGGGRQRRALRWRGADDEATEIVLAEEILPGDLLIVPASYGGCDRFGWNPASRAAVRDLAEEAGERQRRHLALRLHPSLVTDWLGEDDVVTAAEVWPMVCEEIALLGEPQAPELIANLLARGDLPSRLRRRLARLAGQAPELRLPYGEDPTRGVLLVGRKRLPADDTAGEPASESDVLSLAAPRPVALFDHLDRVAAKAGTFAEHLHLPDPLKRAVVRAARLHDLGKAERRFQIYLRGGDRLAADLDVRLLAKSDRFLDPRRAAALAGLPSGIRHEVWSVAAAERTTEGEEPAFRDLVLWLVGTHHGRGRPFFPPVEDPGASDFRIVHDGREIGVSGDPGLHRLDSFWFDLHERLHRRFGPWKLAWLEAILRLADHRASEEEARDRP